MNPGKVFICGENLSDAAVLTSDQSFEASLPLTNLQLSSRGRLWQSTDASVNNLLMTWADAVSPNFAALFRTNLTTSAMWRVFGDTADSPPSVDTGTVVAYDGDDEPDDIFSALMGRRYSLAYFLENEASLTTLGATFTDTSNPDGFLRASRLFVGRGMELALGAQAVSLGEGENTQQARGDGGSLRSDGSISYRELELDVLVDADQRAEFMAMCRIAGMRRDWFVSVLPGEGGDLERDYTMLARLTAMPKLTTTPDDFHAGIYRAKLSFAEI